MRSFSTIMIFAGAITFSLPPLSRMSAIPEYRCWNSLPGLPRLDRPESSPAGDQHDSCFPTEWLLENQHHCQTLSGISDSPAHAAAECGSRLRGHLGMHV